MPFQKGSLLLHSSKEIEKDRFGRLDGRRNEKIVANEKKGEPSSLTGEATSGRDTRHEEGVPRKDRTS